MNIFHHSRAFVEKHKKHHHLVIALLVVLVAGGSGVSLYKKFAHAATFSFTQSSWAGGVTANTATHASNQTGWTEYASSTSVTAGTTVVLPLAPYLFTDDGTATTTGSATGGTFGAGANSSTIVSGSGEGASVGLGADGGTGADGAYSCTSGTCNLAGATYNYTTFNISSGATVNVTGTTALIIKATGAVTIAGTLNLNGGNGYTGNYAGGGNGGSGGYAGGSGGNTGCGDVCHSTSGYSGGGPGGGGGGYADGSNDGGSGGGGGGGYGGYGGGGGITDPAPGGGPGAGGGTYTTITGGSGGGGSASFYGGGGGGGGYLKISSAESIINSGTINANGGNGGDSAGGAGSGGRISLAAPSITNNGAINAKGGSAGAYGGSGGGGRVFLNDSDATIAGTGSVSRIAGTAGYGIGGDNSETYISSVFEYSSSGTFASEVINLGGNANFTTLAWTETLNSQTITMKARSSANSDMSGATAWGSCTNITNGANLSTGGCVTNGHRYIQYQATLSTANTAVTPTLDSVTINYTQYALSGDLTSSKYYIGSDAVISKLTWAGSTTTTETIRFQVQSAPDNGSGAPGTWSGWCGYAETGATCDGSKYFYDSPTAGFGNGVTLGDSHPLRSTSGGGLADRYFQYKVFLGSGGGATPTLTLVTVQYVVNAPPEIQNVTGVQNANGTVTVGYDVRDIDSATAGSATPNAVNVTLQYCTTGSCTVLSDTGWVNATTVTGDVGAGVYVNTGTGAGTAYNTGKSIVWTPATDYAGNYNASQKIRVKASDSEAANSLGYAVPATGFVLDTVVPTITTLNIAASSTPGTVNLTLTDNSTLEYRLCDDVAYTVSCTSWTAITSGVATPVSRTLVNDAYNRPTVYLQVRDAYGNTNSGNVSAHAMPANFIATDTTNLNAGIYREFLSWGTASSTGFGSYKVYYNTTGAGAAYSLLGTVTNVNENYFTHTITTATSSTHFYKVVTVSANSDISEFTLVKSDVPDGSGSTDVTAPYIPFAGIAVSSVGNSSANVTFSTYTDSSIAEGELATSTVRYASYTGTAPTSCPTANSVSSGTYVVNHSIYLTGLTASTNYVFCVLARDIAGNVSTPSSVSEAGGTFTTVGGPVITGVTEREVTDTSALIFWNTDTSSDSKVCYSTTTTGANGCATSVTGTTVTTPGTNANGTFYQHQIGLTGLDSGRTYYYKVVSVDSLVPPNTSTDDRNGQYYSFVTLTDTTPPTITGTSTPVLAPTAAVVVWQTNEMATSKVDYGTVAGVYDKGVAEDTSHSIYHVMTLNSSTNNSGGGGGTNVLIKETPYYYRVTSKDAANNPATADGTFTTPADGNVTITYVIVRSSAGDTTKDTTAPSISNVKIADITAFGATVSFDTDEDTVGFADYGKDTSYGASVGDKTWARTHTTKLRGLTLGTEYHIKVSAVDKAGNTGTGSDQTFKTSFLSENLKDMTKIENIEQFQKEIEDTIESILPSLVPPFVSKPQVTDITENGATVTFRTNIKSFPVVGFVEDALYDATKENPYTGEVSDTTEKTIDHTIALIGLKQNTKYHVQARAFSLPKVIGKSADISFTTKASKIVGSIIERKKDSFTVVWTTDEPTSSVVEYKNTQTGITERKTDDAKRTSHSMRIDNLPSGTTYTVDISGLNEQGNVVEAGAPLSVTTSRDVTPPTISGFKVDNALVPGRTDRIQTIVSWKTDEPSNSTVYYEEGAGTAGDTEELANKNEVLDSYIMAHSVILPNLKPGTIYRLKVTSSDDSGNEGSFGPRTVITPRQTESITDIIFKNFEDSFKFLQKI